MLASYPHFTSLPRHKQQECQNLESENNDKSFGILVDSTNYSEVIEQINLIRRYNPDYVISDLLPISQHFLYHYEFYKEIFNKLVIVNSKYNVERKVIIACDKSSNIEQVAKVIKKIKTDFVFETISCYNEKVNFNEYSEVLIYLDDLKEAEKIINSCNSSQSITLITKGIGLNIYNFLLHRNCTVINNKDISIRELFRIIFNSNVTNKEEGLKSKQLISFNKFNYSDWDYEGNYVNFLASTLQYSVKDNKNINNFLLVNEINNILYLRIIFSLDIFHKLMNNLVEHYGNADLFKIFNQKFNSHDLVLYIYFYQYSNFKKIPGYENKALLDTLKSSHLLKNTQLCNDEELFKFFQSIEMAECQEKEFSSLLEENPLLRRFDINLLENGSWEDLESYLQINNISIDDFHRSDNHEILRSEYFILNIKNLILKGKNISPKLFSILILKDISIFENIRNYENFTIDQIIVLKIRFDYINKNSIIENLNMELIKKINNYPKGNITLDNIFIIFSNYLDLKDNSVQIHTKRDLVISTVDFFISNLKMKDTLLFKKLYRSPILCSLLLKYIEESNLIFQYEYIENLYRKNNFDIQTILNIKSLFT